MGVGGETAFWRVTYDRGCAGDLVSDPIKHPSIDAHNWRGYPLDLSAMNHDALGKIGIDVGHDAVSSTDDGLTDRVAYFFYRFLLFNVHHFAARYRSKRAVCASWPVYFSEPRASTAA